MSPEQTNSTVSITKSGLFGSMRTVQVTVDHGDYFHYNAVEVVAPKDAAAKAGALLQAAHDAYAQLFTA